jgi:hypothetical protein
MHLVLRAGKNCVSLARVATDFEDTRITPKESEKELENTMRSLSTGKIKAAVDDIKVICSRVRELRDCVKGTDHQQRHNLLSDKMDA